MKRWLLSGALAIAIGAPLGWILTMLATPLLWKLEPVLHMELAGHSGPSDWVFLVGWGIVIPATFAIVSTTFLRGKGDLEREPRED